MHALFIVAIVLRSTLEGNAFVYARVFYCLTLLGFYLRFMQAFFVSKNIGPKVIMIQRMVINILLIVTSLEMYKFLQESVRLSVDRPALLHLHPPRLHLLVWRCCAGASLSAGTG